MNFIGKEDNNIVSVILPVYNASNTVIDSIESVIAQSYHFWELIIIDDGSTDNSAMLIQSFIDTLSIKLKNQIIFVHKKNEGPSKTRNLAIEKSRGSMIAFLDSDDIWIPLKLELQVSFLQNDVGIVSGGFNKCLFSDENDFNLITFNDLLKRNFFMTPTVLISRAKLGKYRFPEFQKYSEDYKLWLDITYRYKGLYINKVLAKSVTGKFDFGISGLSSNLWKMEKGELSNYTHLYNENKIGLKQYGFCVAFSLLKCIRRVIIVKLKLYD